MAVAAVLVLNIFWVVALTLAVQALNPGGVFVIDYASAGVVALLRSGYNLITPVALPVQEYPQTGLCVAEYAANDITHSEPPHSYASGEPP